MNGAIIAVVIILVLVVVAFILNKPFGKQLLIKFRGRTDEIMAQDAMTPEGAADYFNNAIREKEEKYSKANQLYVEITGKLDNAEKSLYMSQKDGIKVTRDIESAVDAGRDSDALNLAMKQETINQKIATLKATIEELKKSQEQQKEIRNQLATEVQNLKEEKDRTIFQLQADSQIIELHEIMDKVAANNESDRMLEKVREGANKTRERAAGSRIAYESSMDTQTRRAEQNARQQNAQNIVDEIKRKRGKA